MSKILVIEDDLSILDNLALCLQVEGYQVLTATNGKIGIDLAYQGKPDLILCDVTMPEIDGYGVIEALSSDTRMTNIPFIFMTAKCSGEDVRAGMQLGADDYITKPFVLQDLLAAIETRLAKRERLRQSGYAELERLCESLAHTLPYQLNSPLTGILGATDLLRDLGDEDLDVAEIHDLVNIISTSAGQLKLFNQRLLNYVSLKILKIHPLHRKRDELDLGIAMIQPSINRLAMDCAAMHQRSADLRLDLQNGYIAISDYWLHLLATELLDNAFKFSPAGTPVYLSCDFSQAGFCSIELMNISQVNDASGSEPAPVFCRADHLRDGLGGAGIGLAIVAALLEYHGGTMNYTCTNHQTSVVVTLPTWSAQEMELEAANSDNTSDRRSFTDSQQIKRILQNWQD
jgi:two-component system sensor histidine kinase/response regulator